MIRLLHTVGPLGRLRRYSQVQLTATWKISSIITIRAIALSPHALSPMLAAVGLGRSAAPLTSPSSPLLPGPSPQKKMLRLDTLIVSASNAQSRTIKILPRLIIGT